MSVWPEQLFAAYLLAGAYKTTLQDTDCALPALDKNQMQW